MEEVISRVTQASGDPSLVLELVWVWFQKRAYVSVAYVLEFPRGTSL